MSTLEYAMGRASAAQVATHLGVCDASFLPRLSERVELAPYARKLVARAACFEAWSGGVLVGLVAAYCNDLASGTAFVSSVSVLPDWHGRGIALHLMERCIAHVRALGFPRLELEVGSDNTAAIGLYRKLGLAVQSSGGEMTRMALLLN